MPADEFADERLQRLHPHLAVVQRQAGEGFRPQAVAAAGDQRDPGTLNERRPGGPGIDVEAPISTPDLEESFRRRGGHGAVLRDDADGTGVREGRFQRARVFERRPIDGLAGQRDQKNQRTDE